MNNTQSYINNDYFTDDFLNRVFYIEFDIINNNIPKDQLKNLSDVNYSLVDKEIHFEINVKNFIF